MPKTLSTTPPAHHVVVETAVDADGELIQRFDEIAFTDRDGRFGFWDLTTTSVGEQWVTAVGGPDYVPKKSRPKDKRGEGVYVARTLDKVRVPKGTRMVPLEGFENMVPINPEIDPTQPVWDAPVEAAKAPKKGNAALVGLLDAGKLSPGAVLARDGKECVVQGDAKVLFGGRPFTSLSAAAVAASGRKAANGWSYWLLEDGTPVGDLRKEI